MKLGLRYRPLRPALVASFAVLLTVAAASPTVAQQTAGSWTTAAADSGVRRIPAALNLTAVPSTAAATPTTAQQSVLPGPSLRPVVRGVEPRIAQPNALVRSPAPAQKNTIVISTLALVLIAVIVTILVIK
jgi:hypothetical protein